jgi:hypothetical protein
MRSWANVFSNAFRESVVLAVDELVEAVLSVVDALESLVFAVVLTVLDMVDCEPPASDSISEARSSASFLAVSPVLEIAEVESVPDVLVPLWSAGGPKNIGSGGGMLLPVVPELELSVPLVLVDALAPAFC